MVERLLISRNKLIVLSKLLKALKNIYIEQNKENLANKLRIQRKMVESLLTTEAIDKHIDKLRKELKKYE